MSNLNDLVEALKSNAPDPALKRRMGVVTAIASTYTISVKIAGATNVITGVRYFGHYAPKVGSAVWLDTDGRDWIAVGVIAGLGAAHPSCKVYRTADQSIATGSAWTAVVWQAAEYDPHGMYNGTSLVTVPITGRYLIQAQVQFNANGTSYRGSSLRLNGVTTISFAQTDAAGSTALYSHHNATTAKLTAGDYVQLLVRQNSGAALGLSATTTSESHMTVTYLGPDA